MHAFLYLGVYSSPEQKWSSLSRHYYSRKAFLNILQFKVFVISIVSCLHCCLTGDFELVELQRNPIYSESKE